MKALLYPTYFPSVSHYVAMAKAEFVSFEVGDNFQKQTNRNRMYIYSPNGIQLLNVPLKNSNKKQPTKDVKIDWSVNWQKQHLRSLESAYRSSPFFEYFEDDFITFFTKKFEYLYDLNFETFNLVNTCLGVEFSFDKTTEYFNEVKGYKDFRHLANGKKDKAVFEPYTQVFESKKGYINNLSVLDLLFNEGRHAANYIEKQTI